jgi:phage terminase large subunit-like protein
MDPAVQATADKVREWCEGVQDGSIISCKWVKLAVERHYRDMAEGHLRGLYHDPDQVQTWVEFFRCLRHFEGQWAGEPIDLDPWQLFVVWNVFGWFRANGTRRFRVIYEEVARKTGKSTFLAGVGLGLLVIDGEPAPQVYSGAVDKQHARKVLHSKAETYVKHSPALRRRLNIKKTDGRISFADNDGYFEPLGKDSDVGEGFNPHATLFDELHAHRDRTMWDVIDSGQGARSQPLQWAITTAGFDVHSFCYTEIRDQVCQILEQVENDDDWFGIIFTLDEGDDWRDESVWPKANPQSYFLMQIDDFRRQARQAMRKPAAVNNFLTKRLNVWTSQAVKWVDIPYWRRSPAAPPESELRGRVCFSALDLSANTDLTALVHLFPVDDIADRFDWPDDIIDPEIAALFQDKPEQLQIIQNDRGELVVAAPEPAPEPEGPEDEQGLEEPEPEPEGPEAADLNAADIFTRHRFVAIPRFWIPATRLHDRERRDRVQYERWVNEGLIRVTPGSSIEYRDVQRDIQRDLSQFQIQRLAFDAWGPAGAIMQDLKQAGLKDDVPVSYGQKFGPMSPAMKTLERFYYNGQIAGLNNPVLLWMAANLQAKMDANENIRPDKQATRGQGQNVTKRIDGMVCLIMTIGVWLAAPVKQASVYESRGVFDPTAKPEG